MGKRFCFLVMMILGLVSVTSNVKVHASDHDWGKDERYYEFIQRYLADGEIEDFVVDSVAGTSRIHFLPVLGDAILLESNGLFALVDGGEDSDNPRGFSDLDYPGYEQFVVDYIKQVAQDENGKVTLEFIVGTHAHSDHLGGLDAVVLDPDITVKRA